jgi:hypothetical protein
MVLLLDTEFHQPLRGVITDPVLASLRQRNALRAFEAKVALGQRWVNHPLNRRKTWKTPTPTAA